jgi:hypothetical protein
MRLSVVFMFSCCTLGRGDAGIPYGRWGGTTPGDRLDDAGAVVKRRIAPYEESAAFAIVHTFAYQGSADALVGIVDMAAGDHGAIMNRPVQPCPETLVRQQRRQRMVSDCMK